MKERALMSNRLNESLSAMIDGEAEELELRRVIRSIDDEALQKWQRYQMASSIIKQDKGLFLGSDISAAVSQAIAEEKPHKKTIPVAIKSVISFAVAASVTLAVFTGLQFTQNNEGGVTPAMLDVATNETTTSANTPVFGGGLSLSAQPGFSTVSANLDVPNQSVATERAVADAIAADRLNVYLEKHTSHSTYNNNQGLLPFARVNDTKE